MDEIYLASGLGFSATTRDAIARIKLQLENAGFQVFEPFVDSEDLGEEISRLLREERDFDILKKRLGEINQEIGKRNADAIDEARAIVAVLDGGLDVDSGVAAEIGYGAGRGKKIVGLRTDFRCGGENPGSAVNLQVEYFIKKSGGVIVCDLDALVIVLEGI
ncbi:MAG TPA: nucleoside 2-deoxyribosyltransferase [Candidatus Lokiarchaeia archaeon]|nr:nucleoside 2-deoxyribosyltransferase [Candidatus Lokiarchaeia archaeon]